MEPTQAELKQEKSCELSPVLFERTQWLLGIRLVVVSGGYGDGCGVYDDDDDDHDDMRLTGDDELTMIYI